MKERNMTAMYGLVIMFGVFYPTYANYDPPIRYDVPDDCNYQHNSNSEISLVCTLRTINSELDTTNFTVIPSEHTTSLAIRCFDYVMAKSRLEPKSFAHLVQLRELTLEYCKIGVFGKEALAGLRDLQNLTVRTHNIDWAELNLDIEADVFAYTKNIKRLDLSMNNMWTLPENLFCSLSGLNFLNISSNRLQDIGDLGFRENVPAAKEDKVNLVKQKPSNCSLDLETLDASSNNFVLLPENSFALLRRLTFLKLHNNELTMVADEALGGLRHLQAIDLSANKLVTLPSGFFKDPAIALQEIYLQNNSISVLSNNLFNNLEQLHLLDLSSNQLTSKYINRNTFSGIIRLVLLNLSNNRITTLGPEIFTDLYTLQILNLRGNQLENLAADTFAPMNNLHTLLLSHNKIKYLDAYSLNGLGVLSLLSLDNNHLTGVHPEALRNCSSLQDLNLNANQLTKVPAALKNMRLLRTVDLGENNITAIENPGFEGMDNLYGLRLIGNSIQSLSKRAFKNLPSLQILNIAKNRIESIEPGTFDETTSVQAIRLDGNRLTNVTGLFHKQINMLWLNISDNYLTEFDFSEIPMGLQWLDLHKNYITQLSNVYGLENQLQLQTLDASFNRLVEVAPLSIPNSVELLFLNDNLINGIKPHTFMQKANLTRVDLYANRITSLDVKALRLMAVADDRPLPEFYIGGNPFTCDCNIEWLQKINQVTNRQYPRVMDIETIYCKLLYQRDRSYVQLIDAEPVNFLCSYTTHCFTLCNCCEFDHCDCEMACPDNCKCFHDQSWSTNVVECSAAGYREIPSTVPMDTSELYIDGNDLGELSGHSFIGRKKLMVLYANHSKIHSISNTTFVGLKRLTLLHLEFNDLRKLSGSEFLNLEILRELYLQHNKISTIAAGTFDDLKKLEVLRLDGNRLVNFEAWQLTANPYLVEIGLAVNPWTCDCTFVNQLKIYLDSNTEKLIDANLITCAYKNTTSILKYDKSGVKCSIRDGFPVVRSQEIEDLLPFLLTATLIFVAFFALVFGIFCYRRQLRSFAHAKCLFCCCASDQCLGNEYGKEQLYDAYVISSLYDENFTNQVLAQTLENDLGYRLCLHHRDFNPNAYIFDTVIEAIERSKRTILLLSKNFLYNEWTRFEFKGAVHEVLKRRRKLIVILYGELPQRDLDADMRLYLQNSLCIEWYDKKFWQKVRIALPQIKKKHCLSKDSNVNIYATTHNYNTVARRMIVPACNGPVAMNNFQRNCDSYEPVVCSYDANTAARMAQRQHVYEDPVNCFVDQQRPPPELLQNNDNFCCNVALPGESFECTSSSNCSSASTTARECGDLLDTTQTTTALDAVLGDRTLHSDEFCKNDLNCSCNDSVVNNRASSYSDNSSTTINSHAKEKNRMGGERNAKSEKNNPLMDTQNTYNKRRSPQEIWA